MRPRPSILSILVCLVVLIVSGAQAASASNGMNLIGYGAESLSMGGADLAITDSPAAMNINPAGIGRLVEPEFEFGVGFMNPSLSHTDRLGNDREDSLSRYPMPFLGYVHPVGHVTLGAGLFVQGGLGVEYRDLVSPISALAHSGMFPPGFFGNSEIAVRDNVKTMLSHAKLTPSVAWRLGSNVTLGATLNVSYAQAEMQFLPNTSLLADLDRSGVPGDSPREMLFGMHVDEVSTFAYGLRLGVQYRRGPLSIGGAFATETDLDFDDGTMTLNLSALRLGRVNYDAQMEGFTWPQQAGVGVGYRLHPKLLIAFDLDWINWSSALGTVTIHIDSPDNPLAPPSRQIPMQMNWDDQLVWALGFEVNPRPKWAARFGYNHGDSPIPDAVSRPQFPAIAEDHVTGGLGYSAGRWNFDLGFEYVPKVDKTNNNPDQSLNPFGPGSTETLSQIATYFTLRRAV